MRKIGNKKKTVKVPNPGSPEAQALNCTCPIDDNHHGAGCGKTKEGHPLFWYTSGCPVHTRRGSK